MYLGFIAFKSNDIANENMCKDNDYNWFYILRKCFLSHN